MFIRTLIFAILSLLLFERCAQVVSPTGGKKDSIPPELVSSNPANKTLNFKGDRIEMLFNEYVIVDNINQKLVITPEVDNPYTYKLNGESIILNFKKKFADSTTYTLNFGDAIKDNSERNPAKNLKLVFSTGAQLDSGRVYGRVIDIKTNKPLLDVLVGLYQQTDTLNPSKDKPYYFSRTDSSGIFLIENVQIGNYKLISVEDKNRNMLYNGKDERIGFLNEQITVNSDTSNYKIFMALSDNTGLRIQRTIPKVNNYTAVFNKNIEDIKVKFEGKDSLPYILETNQIKFFNVATHSDTIKTILIATDSLGIDSTFHQKISFQQQRGKERQKEPFNITTTPEKNKPLPNDFTYTLTFNKPILSIDSNTIQLLSDSSTITPLKDFSYIWNKYHNEIKIKVATTAKDSINWTLPYGSIISIENDTLPQVQLKHTKLNEDNYGIITGTVINMDSTADAIIELIDEQFKVIKTSYNFPYKFIHIPEGKYYLRLIIDRNKNKKWDTSQITKGIQPEPIIYIQDKFLIKSNFELNDININVPPNI